VCESAAMEGRMPLDRQSSVQGRLGYPICVAEPFQGWIIPSDKLSHST
jgi:hypothetical protein